MKLLARFFLFLYNVFAPKTEDAETGDGPTEMGKCEVKSTMMSDGQIRLEIDHDKEFIEYLRNEGGFQGNDEDVLFSYLQTLLRDVVAENHSNPGRYQ